METLFLRQETYKVRKWVGVGRDDKDGHKVLDYQLSATSKSRDFRVFSLPLGIYTVKLATANAFHIR